MGVTPVVDDSPLALKMPKIEHFIMQYVTKILGLDCPMAARKSAVGMINF
jgi:hypothetical protein